MTGLEVDDQDLVRADLQAVEAPEFRKRSRIVHHFLFPVNLPAAAEERENVIAA